MLKGSCNCGRVVFAVDGGSDSVTACHCGQCRKQSGNYWASAHADVSAFEITGEVTWFQTSPTAKRGFCPTCGCFLFWKAHDEDGMCFSLGAIDGPTGLRLHRHIFTRFKGDWYDIADGVPQERIEA